MNVVTTRTATIGYLTSPLTKREVLITTADVKGRSMPRIRLNDLTDDS